MRAIRIIVIVVQVFFMLGCTTNTKEQKNATKKQMPSEITNAQATNYFVNQSHDDAEEGANGEVDLTNEIAGAADARISFRFDSVTGVAGYQWQIDDVEVEVFGGGSTGGDPPPPLELPGQAEMPNPISGAHLATYRQKRITIQDCALIGIED